MKIRSYSAKFFINFDGEKNLTVLAWYTFDKKLHSYNDIPSLITYYDDKSIYCKYWNYDGNSMRLQDKPHVVRYYKNGNIQIERWHTKTDGSPIYITYYENRNVKASIWGDYPAYNSVYYYENGKKQMENWMYENELHRTNGPAQIMYYPNGNLECELWRQQGNPY